MSVAAKKWVRKHSSARGPARTVLAELAWAGDDAGQGARLSQRELVAATGLSRATVQRALASLESDQHARRHRGGRDHCDACRRAQRGVVVFDVVMPRQEAEPIPGQLSLDDQPHHEPADQPQMRPVAEGHRPQSEAGTGLRVRHLEEYEEDQHHHLGRASDEAEPSPPPLVDDVAELLGRVVKPGWFVDRIAVDALVMTWSPHRDPMRAAAAVVASAMSHHHLNAARLLAKALEWQRPDPKPADPAPGVESEAAASARRADALARLAGLQVTA